jgi:hypothetical protein
VCSRQTGRPILSPALISGHCPVLVALVASHYVAKDQVPSCVVRTLLPLQPLYQLLPEAAFLF